MLGLIVAGLAVSALTAFSIGANDLANSIAPLVGSGAMRFNQALIVFSVVVLTGAMVQGYMVIKTLGKGIVSDIDIIGAVSASLAAFIWIMLATVKGIPISTTHSITGGVIGIGIAYMLLSGKAGNLNLDIISKILLSWVTSPLLAMVLAIPLYHLTERVFSQGNNGCVVPAAIAIASFAAYSFGANDVANAVGVYISVTSKFLGLPDSDTMRLLTAFAVLFICLGGAVAGKRVVETLAYRVTRLDLLTSVAANADAIAVWLYTTVPFLLFGYGLPISTSYAAVGAIIGAGVAKHKSLRALNLKLVLFIMFAWVITVPVTASLAIAIYTLLSYIL
jgi:Phosphate/sulphate permeases